MKYEVKLGKDLLQPLQLSRLWHIDTVGLLFLTPLPTDSNEKHGN